MNPTIKEKKVVIIDYKNSNLFSVQNACRRIGLNPTITSDKNLLANADAAILPGVGAFGDAMKNLEKHDLINPIKDFVQSGRPFMGICLGLQLLFSESEEFALCQGLDIIKGRVIKFPPENMHGDKIKVPHIGWNRINKKKYTELNLDHSPLERIRDGEYMYFIHSYYVVPEEDHYCLTHTNYEGIDYCSSVFNKNLFATQFHPEKSAENGIEIYRKWAETI